MTKTIWGLRVVVCYSILLFGINTTYAQKSELDKAQNYHNKGIEFYNAEEYDKSIASYNKAIAIARKLKENKLLGEVLTRKGHTYLLDGQYQKAIDIYYKALETHKKTKDLRWENAALSGLATTLKRMGQLDRAYEITQKIFKLLENPFFEDTDYKSASITSANELYIALEEYDSVLYFADKAIEISKKMNFKKGLIHLYIEKGMAYYYKENYTASFEYLFKAKELLDKFEINRAFFPTVHNNYYIASCYYQQQAYDKAISYLLKNIDMSTEQDHKKMYVIQCYLLLANCYAEQQNFEKALWYNNEYMRLNASYEKEKDATANKIFEKDALALQQNIARLQAQKEQEQAKKRWGYIGLGLVSVLLFGLGMFFVTRQRSNKRVFNALMAKIDLLETAKQDITIKKEPTKGVIIDDQKVVELLQKIEALENEQYFLRVDCSLKTMAKKAKTNATYLSKIINTHKQKNFSTYINDLRIDFAINRLRQDPLFRKYTVKAIAQEVGFKSAESFAKTFYKKTGLYPSYFLKELDKKLKTAV